MSQYYEYMDQALAANKGIRIQYANESMAWNRRMEFYKARVKDRRMNDERGLGPNSPYDNLTFIIEGSDLYIMHDTSPETEEVEEL